MYRKFVNYSLVLILSSASGPVASHKQSERDRYDVIIRNGTVFDGSGREGVRTDVGIVDGHVVAVGDLSKAGAAEEIDAQGRFVAPGFINIHDHPTADGLVAAKNMLTQGVTTEIFNADGGVLAPKDTDPPDLDAQLKYLQARGLATNIGGAIGFNAVWESIVGKAPRRATADEIVQMRAVVDRNFRAGAFALSAGLDYKPGYYATAAEVVAVASAARPWRTNFPNHERLTPENGFSSIKGSAETIEIARKAGLVPVITHIKAQGREQGRASEMLEMIDAVTRSGGYATGDVYPYIAGQTGLAYLIIPAWALEGGRDALLTRLKDPTQRTRIARDTETAINARFGGPDGVYVVDIKRQLTDVMKEQGTTAGETVLRLLEKADMMAVLRFGNEIDIAAFLRHPAIAVACDCGARADAATHPRQTGTFPRVLGRYVREQGLLTWGQAIRKMTALPAATIGLVDRGYLAPGMAADVVVFDPETVIDRSTFEQPSAFSTGITEVLVNGKIALRQGKPTDVQGGAALRRGVNMPSRAVTEGKRMLTGIVRLTDVTGLADAHGPFTLRYSVVQAAEDRVSRGTMTITARHGVALRVKKLGVLQMDRGWAAVTGVARLGDGRHSPVTVIVDQANPLAPARQETIIITGQGFSARYVGRPTAKIRRVRR